ncbi:UNVERIFIED_CONTAM: hypothetical protein GTU68_015279 [Idotea baltica]|nr:hypothetical protein [Idotea baltica]
MGYQLRSKIDCLHDFHETQLALANGDKLDDQRLLILLLARNLPHQTAEQVADKLLKKFTNLASVFSSKLEELLDVKGVSQRTAIDLLQVKHLLSAISWTMVSKRPIIDCYEKMITFCAGQFVGSQQEQFHALFLNKRYELVYHKRLQVGTLDHVTVYPREVLRIAIEHSASHLILAHNHPFGRAKPSRADIKMTEHIYVLAQGLGIGILDHIIFADNDTFSFLKNKIMPRSSGDLLDRLQPIAANNWK